jgi:hypothetical protein
MEAARFGWPLRTSRKRFAQLSSGRTAPAVNTQTAHTPFDVLLGDVATAGGRDEKYPMLNEAATKLAH